MQEAFNFDQPLIIGSALAAWYVYDTFIATKFKDGEIVTKNAFYVPSFTAKQHQLSGRSWTLPYDVYNTYKYKKFEINYFTYALSTIRKTRAKRWIRNLVSNYVKGKIDPIDLTKQLIVFGAMGTGKTVFFWNLLLQKGLYNRALVLDTKGDYRELVNNITVFTLNIFDENAKIWNIFAEKNFYQLINLFTSNMMNQVTGESGNNNFFVNSAADRLQKIFEMTYLKSKAQNLTGSEKWQLLLDEIANYENEVQHQKATDAVKENSDVYNNLLLALRSVKFWAWRASKAKNKLFTISEYFTQNYTYIMHQDNKEISSFYAGFLAAVIDENKRQPETTRDFTLYLLDEYFQLHLDNQSRNTLHTLLRSKGAQVVIGLQNPPKKEIADICFSSKLAFVVFRSDGNTLKFLEQDLGKIEYKIHAKPTRKGHVPQPETRTRNFVDHDEVENLPEFTHLYLDTLNKIYYVGKVHPTEKGRINQVPYVEINLDAFKKELYAKELNKSKKDNEVKVIIEGDQHDVF